MVDKLTKEQLAWIKCAKQSCNHAVCLDTKHPLMLKLIELGYFTGPIKVSWLHDFDSYFQLTEKGVLHEQG